MITLRSECASSFIQGPVLTHAYESDFSGTAYRPPLPSQRNTLVSRPLTAPWIPAGSGCPAPSDPLVLLVPGQARLASLPRSPAHQVSNLGRARGGKRGTSRARWPVGPWNRQGSWAKVHLLPRASLVLPQPPDSSPTPPGHAHLQVPSTLRRAMLCCPEHAPAGVMLSRQARERWPASACCLAPEATGYPSCSAWAEPPGAHPQDPPQGSQGLGFSQKALGALRGRGGTPAS